MEEHFTKLHDEPFFSGARGGQVSLGEVVVLRPARHRARRGSPTAAVDSFASTALLEIRRVSTLRAAFRGLDTRIRRVTSSGRRQA